MATRAKAMSEGRPAGVKALIALCVLTALTSLAFALLLAGGRIPLSAGAFVIGGGLEQLGPVAFLLYAAFVILLALALWKRWPGSRRAAIVVAAIGIAMAVPALSSAVMDSRTLALGREGLQIIVRVMVIYYLSQEPVSDWFARR